MLAENAGSWDGNVPTVQNCRFVTASFGTIVYRRNGIIFGVFETEDAATEMIREMTGYTGGGEVEI